MKFSGRETSVIRSIDFATGTMGAELLAKTRIEFADLLDILNGLLDAGYIETNPPTLEHLDPKTFYHTVFEVNPAYAQTLRKAVVH
jgi:hypothetical protein